MGVATCYQRVWLGGAVYGWRKAMANDGATERVTASETASNNRQDVGGGEGNPNVLDLGTFMNHYHRVRDQLWPLGRLLLAIEKTRRWENYAVSLGVSISLTLLLFYPRALLLSTSILLFIMILAGNQLILGSFFGTSRDDQRNKTTPTLISHDAQEMERQSKEERKRQKSLKEYRYIVKKADDVLISLGYTLDNINSIFTWSNPRVSTNVCFFLLIVSISLIWISVSTLLSLLCLLFFYFNHHFINETKAVFNRISFTITRNQQISPAPNSNSIAEAIQNTFRTETTQDQSNNDNQNDDNNTVNNSNNTEDMTGSGEVNERPHKKENEKGNCYKCGASFSLLKRKHTCNYCGRTYCGSCTVKVTKSSLGATSPAAFQQTVRVCQDCKNELDNSNQSGD